MNIIYVNSFNLVTIIIISLNLFYYINLMYYINLLLNRYINSIIKGFIYKEFIKSL